MRAGDAQMQPLDEFLLKELEPISEADPKLLSSYVAALLRNDKPQKELKQLCLDQLVDFLGGATGNFVNKLFVALENGSVRVSEAEPGERVLTTADGEAHEVRSIENGAAAQEEEAALEAAAASAGLRSTPSQTGQVSDRSREIDRPQVDGTAKRENGTGRIDEEEGGEQESSDEDDDRNHKHRRRGLSSRLTDRKTDDRLKGDGAGRGAEAREEHGYLQTDDDKGTGKGLIRPGGDMRRTIARLPREFPGRPERRDHFVARFGPAVAGRFPLDGAQRGSLPGGRQPPFREGFEGPNGNLIPRGMSHGRGVVDGWGHNALSDRHFGTPPFGDGQPPLVGLPAGGPGFFPSRGIARAGVGAGPQTNSPWGGFGPMSVRPNPMERGPPVGPGVPVVVGGMVQGAPPPMGIGLRVLRMRCPDFEERGFCLRGDLCPMDHGADRIVLEDIKHLQQLNLPLPSNRSIGPATIPANTPSLPGHGRRNRIERERDRNLDAERLSPEPSLVSSPRGTRGLPDDAAEANGEESVRGEHYDPDQLLWSRDRLRPKPAPGSGRLASLMRPRQEDRFKNGEEGEDQRKQRIGLTLEGGGRPASEDAQAASLGQNPGIGSVWDRIGPPAEKAGGSLTPVSTVDLGPRGIKRGRSELIDGIKWEVEPERVVAAGLAGNEGIASKQVAPGQGRGRGGSEAQGGRGGGRWGNGVEKERAQRTLFVRNLPTDLQNADELLTRHFCKFGQVVSVKITQSRDRAFVQFANKPDAESALAAPEAVMGNRFITLHWAFHDNYPEHSAGSWGAPNQLAPIAIPNFKGGNSQANFSPSIGAQLNRSPSAAAGSTGETTVATSASTTAQVAAVAQAKQREKLELLKEIQRKKEALLRAQIEQRKKMLERLAKSKQQGSSEQNSLPAATDAAACGNSSSPADGETPLKGGRTSDSGATTPHSWNSSKPTTQSSRTLGQGEVAEEASGSVPHSGSNAEASSSLSPYPSRPLSGGWQTARAGAGGAIRTPATTGHLRSAPYHSPWGPARYKLDNRSTVLRVLPPLPAIATEPGALWAHFSTFAEVASVEAEAAEPADQSASTSTGTGGAVKVTFTSRGEAERAMAQGKMMQGAQLQLAWGPPAKSKSLVAAASTAGGADENTIPNPALSKQGASVKAPPAELIHTNGQRTANSAILNITLGNSKRVSEVGLETGAVKGIPEGIDRKPIKPVVGLQLDG